MKNKRKKISLLLAAVLVINLISLVSIQAWGTVAEELQKTQSQIVGDAVNYLVDGVNTDGSFGNNTNIINETAEAVAVLNCAGSFDDANSVKWLKDNGYDDNIDTLARTAIASGDAEILESILAFANSDGGYGLHENYTSDILDSVLVLEAINVCGSSLYIDEGSKLCVYLAGKINDDGGWAYSRKFHYFYS